MLNGTKGRVRRVRRVWRGIIGLLLIRAVGDMVRMGCIYEFGGDIFLVGTVLLFGWAVC